jgi:hypothetical protein
MSRRVFLGSVPVSTLMVWRSGQMVSAQQAEKRDLILDHVTREAARLQSEIRSGGLRSEHLRAYSLNLRLAAAHGRQQGLDAAIRRAARRANGNKTTLLNELEGRTDYEHEKHRFEQAFPDLKGLELDVTRGGRWSRGDYEKALDIAATRGGFTESHDQLLRLAEGIRTRLERSIADNGGVLHPGRPRIMRVQHGSCEMYRMSLDMAELMVNAVCALVVFDPALAPICAVLWLEVQVAKFLMLVACGG